jgi:serine protease Do
MISNLSRKAAPEPQQALSTSMGSIHHYGTLIQTDAKLNLGTSGGALLNLKGEMIGLTTSLAAVAGYEKAAGYAIPVDEVFKRIVETLKAGREVEYGFLGVRPENLAHGRRLRGEQGVVVDQVVRATPADRAAVRSGDVITRVDGRPIHDADGLILSIGRQPAETVVRLTLERGGRTLRKNVKLSKKFVLSSRRSIVTDRAPLWRGIRVDYDTATADFKSRSDFGEVDPDGCVVVVEVQRESQAWETGIRPGVFITHVDDTRVVSPDAFHAAVADKKGPVRLRLSGTPASRATQTIWP